MIIMDKKLNYNSNNSNNILNYHIPDKNLKKNIISWLGYLNLEKGFSKKTILSYEIDFRKFLNFLCWHKNYKDVDLSILSNRESSGSKYSKPPIRSFISKFLFK